MGLETDRNWVIRKGGRGSKERQHVGGGIDSRAHPGSLNVYKLGLRARIFKLLRSGNRFQGISSASLYSLAGRNGNPIPTWFLAPIDCLKIPAQLRQVPISSSPQVYESKSSFFGKKFRSFYFHDKNNFMLYMQLKS